MMIVRVPCRFGRSRTVVGRGGAATPEVAGLDRDLQGLRGLCAREGGASRAAFDHLERWRYRAEDQVRLWREAVGDEAGRALGNPGNSQ